LRPLLFIGNYRVPFPATPRPLTEIAMFARMTIAPIVLSVVLASTGCRFFRPIDPNNPRAESPKETSAPASKSAPAAQAPRPVPRGSISDANIAAMVLALNNTDISYARLVPSRAQRDDVKKFAERMLTDHTGVNALVTQLLTKLDVAPEDNAISLDMRDESANKRDLMRELSGFAFDSTYMENEVAYHQKFLASIDNQMLPSARNADLRALLSAVRPAVAAHLAHAEQVRADVLAKK
jgi:putative membrane protein